MKQKLLNLIRNHHQKHSKKWTVWLHFVGVPLVAFSAFIFFGWIKISVPNLFSLSVAWLGVLIFLIYYLYLDLIIGAAASVLLIILCAIANIFTMHGPTALSIKLFVITFILGWIFQLIAHAIEGKKPALLNNFFESVFSAPFFISAKFLFIFGIKKDVEQAMQGKSTDEL